jgi:hypothetical protein
LRRADPCRNLSREKSEPLGSAEQTQNPKEPRLLNGSLLNAQNNPFCS